MLTFHNRIHIKPPQNNTLSTSILLYPLYTLLVYKSRRLKDINGMQSKKLRTTSHYKKHHITNYVISATKNFEDEYCRSSPINSRLNVVVRSPTLFGLGRNACWPFQGFQLLRALLFIFSLCCTLNDRSRAAHSFFKVGRLFSLFLFSCPSLALLRLSSTLLSGI